MTIYLGNLIVGKRENLDILMTLEHEVGLTLISRKLKYHNGFCIRIGEYRSQVINRVLSQVWFTVGPWSTHPPLGNFISLPNVHLEWTTR